MPTTITRSGMDFLTWRRLTSSVAELLSKAFLEAVQHINRDLSNQQRRDRFTSYSPHQQRRDRFIELLYRHARIFCFGF